MGSDARLIAAGIGLVALVLALAFGPLVAGYAFAGAGLLIVLALITASVAKAIHDWGLGHGWGPLHGPHWRWRVR